MSRYIVIIIMTVCGTPHIPIAVTTEPYVAGREYAINRSNPEWQYMKPLESVFVTY